MLKLGGAINGWYFIFHWKMLQWNIDYRELKLKLLDKHLGEQSNVTGGGGMRANSSPSLENYLLSLGSVCNL